MDYKELTAKSVDEAITKACIELSITSDKLDYDVISEGSSGFLGIGSRPAVIRYREKPIEQPKIIEDVLSDDDKKKMVTADDIEARAAAAAQRDKELGIVPEKRNDDRSRGNDKKNGGRRRNGRGRDNDRSDRFDRNERGDRNNRHRRGRSQDISRIGGTILTEEKPHEPSVPKPQRKVTPRTEEQVAAIETRTREFLEGVFRSMNLNVKITMEYDQEEGALNCLFDGGDMGILIGKHGQTLDSLQYLTSLVVNKDESEYVRVKLDTEDYRSRRKEALINLSRNIAYKVKQTRHAIALEPMNPYERRIIHSALQGNKDVETYSEGEEPYRHVVVTLKKN